MTSNDRHASHDSAFRTGRHMPLSQSRNGPLGAHATTAMESSTDLSNDGAFSANNLASPSVPQQTPYSPGARSQAVRRGSSDTVNQGEIQMQNFEEGLPPPPPVSHSWKRVDRWAEDNYTELYDQLGEGATNNDLNELEHELDCSLPVDVRESVMCHDGQERGGRPTGIIFGCMLLDCEEIVQEWRNWRTVNEEYLQAVPTGSVSINMATSSKSMAGPGVGSSTAPPPPAAGVPTANGPNPFWRQELLDRQESQPPRAIQKAYAHAGWIPLARDWGGNCIAVDLAPGPTGKWGQVIIFGRDYDCKYVIARSWGAFMAQLADDFGSGKVEMDDDSEWDSKLRLKQFKDVDPPYLEILRWRTDQKYGRRFPKRKGPAPGAGGQRRGSPYGSPIDERGRSPQRFPSSGVGSPARVGSPLAKVDEEGKVNIHKPTPMNPSAVSKLVDAPTPAVSSTDLVADVANETTGPKTKDGDDKVGLGVEGLESDMKTVAI